jgi:hypothetical protein
MTATTQTRPGTALSVRTDRGTLLDALVTAGLAVPTRPALPVLAGVLLVACDGDQCVKQRAPVGTDRQRHSGSGLSGCSHGKAPLLAAVPASRGCRPRTGKPAGQAASRAAVGRDWAPIWSPTR